MGDTLDDNNNSYSENKNISNYDISYMATY